MERAMSMFNKYKDYLAKDVLLAGLLLFTLFPEKMDRLQKPEPGKKIKVFLFAGQSNMDGRADAHKLGREDHDRLLRARNNVRLAYNYEPVCPLKPVKPSPEIAEIYKRDLIFGPELFFGIAVSEAWPQEKILLIKRSEGGTSLQGCWHPEWREDKAAVVGEEQGPQLYRAFIDYVGQVLSEYKIDEYEICGMMWVQGETDAGNKIAAAAYGRNLGQLIRHIRQDVGNENLPFLLFQVGNEKVVEGMKKTAQHLPNVFLLPQSTDPASTDYYPKMENGHYNYEGMKKLGQRFAEVFLNRIKEAE
jgi:hypothetical protein